MSYEANDIESMDFPLCIQKRSSMYLGGSAKDKNSPGQMNVAVREILDNSVTEALKGYATHIDLTFHKDGFVSCLDNGRGIPVGINEQTGKNGIIMTMATLHSGGNFSLKEGTVGPGLNGVGGSCVNALSSRFDVEVYKGKFKHNLSFQDGYPGHFDEKGDFTPGEKIAKEKFEHEQGTLVRFNLNPEYFADSENIVVDDIIDRCRFVVYIVPGLSITVIDETRKPEDGGGTYNFEATDGINEMVDFISTGDAIITSNENEYSKNGVFSLKTKGTFKKKIVDISSGKAKTEEKNLSIPIEVAFKFTNKDASDVRSFANSIMTHRGGIHEDALKDALMDTFGKEAMKLK